MQRTYQFFIFIAIFALSFQPLKGAGLLFSRETPQTYLDLFSGNDISFTNSVTISFDLSIHSHESFGQIWVYEDKAAPYSFAYIGRDKSSSSFVINSLTDKKQFLEIPVSPQAIGARRNPAGLSAPESGSDYRRAEIFARWYYYSESV